MEKKLIEALSYCKEKFGWTVCIKDFFNLMLCSRGTSELISCYINHENGYCTKIKSNPVAFSHCVEEGNEKLREHILKMERPEDGFFGVCYAGVREFVMPIYYRNEPIGAVIIGACRCEEERQKTTFARLREEFGFEEVSLSELYRASLPKDLQEEFLIRHEALLIAAFIQMLCERNLDPETVKNAVRRESIGISRSAKLNHAILYIKKNLIGRITVEQVAKACFCSESSISHLFKETMGEGVNAFILRERVSMAQRMILHTDDTMAEIAARCGFGTNKYMTGVFKKQIGMTPTEFKSRNKPKG